MIFDVGIRESKQKAAYFRVHDRVLSQFVRKAQDAGQYVFSIIPLFKQKKDKNIEYAIANGIVGDVLEDDDDYRGI